MARKQSKENPPDSGNRPFKELEQVVQRAGIVLRGDQEKVAPAAAGPAPLPESESPPESDDRLFERAMQDVDRISWRTDPAPSPQPAPAVPADREDKDRRLFLETIESETAPPILEHPEYIEGWIGIAGLRFLPNLRSGTYSIQGQIDLHGLSRVEARAAVEDFVIRISRERSSCVKIVHGRGINSPTDKAILKENLQRWLTTRRMSHHVVAYASAPYTDGGVGAIYVLLRRKQSSGPGRRDF